MSEIQEQITQQVKSFVADPDGPSDEMIDALLAADRSDITGKAAVRYMMQVGAWRFERNGGFHHAMNHFFAHYEGRETIDPEQYQTLTKDLIKDLWGYECKEIVPAPKVEAPVKKAKPKAKTKAKAYTVNEDEEEGESGSRIFKSIREQDEIDTRGASDRLKKTIAIQRNS